MTKAQVRRWPGQPADCQRFEGQTVSWQHVHPGPVKNARPCGICGSNADKTKTGTFVCQANPAHMADGVVGIWSDLTFPEEQP